MSWLAERGLKHFQFVSQFSPDTHFAENQTSCTSEYPHPKMNSAETYILAGKEKGTKKERKLNERPKEGGGTRFMEVPRSRRKNPGEGRKFAGPLAHRRVRTLFRSCWPTFRSNFPYFPFSYWPSFRLGLFPSFHGPLANMLCRARGRHGTPGGLNATP
jgi:hypothetical protein